jgi:hypothetical protein
MYEPKVRLNLVIPGATMLSSQECEKLPQKEAYNLQKIDVSYKTKKGKKVVFEKDTLHIYTRKSRTAKQSLSINQEAYYHMIDAKNVPSPKFAKTWKNMSNKNRLEYHLDLIAEALKAISYSYEILDD